MDCSFASMQKLDIYIKKSEKIIITAANCISGNLNSNR